MKPVIIVGAGFGGLISLKICLENGLEAHCYERLDNFGGLWRFREDVDVDGIPSVTKNTIIDTSKEIGALSDFPPPADFPNYMHNSKVLEYLMMYVKANKLESRIRFQHEVLNINKAGDYQRNGTWKVLIKNKLTNEEEEVEAQAVLICTGHHAYPNYPKFLGQDDFQGRIVHSHSLKSPSEFEGKSVVVVGTGNSAMDAAAELSFLSKQVYLSTRRGTWISPRMGPNGYPLDFRFTRLSQFLYDHFPNKWRKLNEDYMNSQFNHELYGLKPRHHVDQQHPSVSDIVPARILAGAIKVKGDIARITPKGAVFKGEEGIEVAVDAIILCTGYNVRIPFLPKDDQALPTSPQKNDISLFERMFPVHLPHPTLAFIGMTQPIGPIFPLMELQSRWLCRLLVERQKPGRNLESLGWPSDSSSRAAEVSRYKLNVSKRFVQSQRHTLEVDYVSYMEHLAKKIGCQPNLVLLAVTDPVLFFKLIFGPFVSYQFRMSGPHSWTGARAAVLSTEQRVRRAFTTGSSTSAAANVANPYLRYTIAFAVFCVLISILYMFFTF